MPYSARLTLVNDRAGLIIMASFFIILTTLLIALRFYSRHIQRAMLGTDDWLALASLVFVTALNACFIAGCVEGAITGHSEVVNGLPVTSPLENLVQQYKYGFQSTEKIGFALIKLSILFLWLRIFSRAGRWFVILCWTMIGLTAGWGIAFFFATIFQCGTNWDWNWSPIFFFLTECTDTLMMLTVFTATDLLSDFIIMLMPVPLIWSLNMPLRKKAGVTAVFLLGLFTIGAGIARMYIYLVTSYDQETNPDFIGDFTLFILWSEIEINVALMVCCMPALGPVLDRARSHMRRSPFNKWIQLGPTTRSSNSKKSKDTELSINPKMENNRLAWTMQDDENAPWHLGESTKITASGPSPSKSDFPHGNRILAKTEISRTLEGPAIACDDNRRTHADQM